MKILPWGAQLFVADGRTDGHDEANIRFSQFCEKSLNHCWNNAIPSSGDQFSRRRLCNIAADFILHCSFQIYLFSDHL